MNCQSLITQSGCPKDGDHLICYHIMDLEDGCKLGHVPKDDGEKAILNLLEQGGERIDEVRKTLVDIQDRIGYLRALAIRILVKEAANAFKVSEVDIMNGSFDNELTDVVNSNAGLKDIDNINKTIVYKATGVLEIEAAGYEVIDGLLDAYVRAADDVAEKGIKASSRSRKLFELIPKYCAFDIDNPIKDQYIRTLKIVDHIAGMTDTYAINHYRTIRGIALPH